MKQALEKVFVSSWAPVSTNEDQIAQALMPLLQNVSSEGSLRRLALAPVAITSAWVWIVSPSTSMR